MLPFIFLLPEQKKNETKRKFAGSRSRAKKWRFFLNEKNSLALRQLFVLHGKISIFLHALPLNAGTCSSGWGVNVASLVFGVISFCGCFSRSFATLDDKKCRVPILTHFLGDIHLNERSNVASNVRPHFLSVKRRCFSER